jgi:FkbM family methyltransferase
LIFAAVPRLRGYMRDPRGAPFKRWLYRCFLDPYTNFRPERFETTTVFGTRLEGTLSGFVQRRVFHFGIYEPNLTALVRECLQPGDVFVDVGANVGYFSLLAVQLVGPSGSVVAVEAAPSTLETLQRNLARNAAHNVRVVACAAYDRETVLPFYTVSHEENASGATVARAIGPHEADVRAAPLATILTAEEIARARLIKIDVEGAEEAAVAGLLPVIPSLRSDVELIVETLPHTAANVSRMLVAFGFKGRRLPNPPDPLDRSEIVTYLVFSR